MIFQNKWRWAGCLALFVCSGAPLLAAENELLDDLSARIQFEYYSADARALRRDLDALKQLKPSESDEILRTYYLAYGHMKLAEVLSESDRSSARKAASECSRYTHEVTDTEPKRVPAKERARLDTLYAELWAIQATCIYSEADLAALPVPAIYDNRARAKAAALVPSNPRVQLLAAIYAAKKADNTQRRTVAGRKLTEVTDLFDAAIPANGMPDWGHAEAFAWLGQNYLQLGDMVAARNALERSLVLAPDFAWARKLQMQLKSSR